MSSEATNNANYADRNEASSGEAGERITAFVGLRFAAERPQATAEELCELRLPRELSVDAAPCVANV